MVNRWGHHLRFIDSCGLGQSKRKAHIQPMHEAVGRAEWTKRALYPRCMACAKQTVKRPNTMSVSYKGHVQIAFHCDGLG